MSRRGTEFLVGAMLLAFVLAVIGLFFLFPRFMGFVAFVVVLYFVMELFAEAKEQADEEWEEKHKDRPEWKR